MVCIAWRHGVCKSLVFNIPYNDLQTSFVSVRESDRGGKWRQTVMTWPVIDTGEWWISCNLFPWTAQICSWTLMWYCWCMRAGGWIRIRDVSWQRSDLLIMHVLSPRGRYGARLLYWDIDWCEHLYICMCGLTWSYTNRNIVWVYKTYMYNILKVLRPNLKTFQVQSTCKLHAQGLEASSKCQSTAKVLLHGIVLEENRFSLILFTKAFQRISHLEEGPRK